MTATDLARPATTRREHKAAENAARVLHDDAAALDKKLCRDYEMFTQHMDPDERERFGDGLNALHDLVSDLAGMVRFHETAAERADWTAQEWREYELVAANID
jgi:hypothetical protein